MVRRDLNKNNVAVISGGGSGHEPAHVGFIGKGMLTAAVCGDVFASPSVDAVLTAIRAVTGEAGCLLIVKNYTGDRLNFGLAAEKARRLGYNVEMLIVGDDISLPDNKHPRGIAGTIPVHKIAGYFAERGYNLATVLREAQYAANNTFSPALRFPAVICRKKPTPLRVIIRATRNWAWAFTANQRIGYRHPEQCAGGEPDGG